MHVHDRRGPGRSFVLQATLARPVRAELAALCDPVRRKHRDIKPEPALPLWELLQLRAALHGAVTALSGDVGRDPRLLEELSVV